MEIEQTIISFEKTTVYQIGAVTYEVAAHFCSEEEHLKPKINRLLKLDLQKSDLIRTFADGQGRDVE